MSTLYGIFLALIALVAVDEFFISSQDNAKEGEADH